MVQVCSNTKSFELTTSAVRDGTGINIEVYDRQAPGTRLLTRDNDTYDRRWSDPVKGIGQGSLIIPFDHRIQPVEDADSDWTAFTSILNNGHIESTGNIVRVLLDGIPAYAFLSENTEGAWQGDNRVLTVDGPGLIAVLDDIVIYPEDFEATCDTRLFTFASKLFDHTIAGFSQVFFDVQRDDPPFDGLLEPEADPGDDDYDANNSALPDFNARWIWTEDNTGTVPAGHVYLVSTYNPSADREGTVYFSADNAADLYINGCHVGTHDSGPSTVSRFDFLFQSGKEYLFAARAQNNGNTRGGFILTMTTTHESDPVNEVQELTFGDTISSGCFTLKFGGDSTNCIGSPWSASEVESELNSLDSIGAGGTTVTGSGVNSDPYVITFSGGEVAGQDVDTIATDHTTLIHSPASAGDSSTTVTKGKESEDVETVRFRSDSDWDGLGYPLTLPAMTVGHVLRLLEQEFAGRGGHVFWNREFTVNEDTELIEWGDAVVDWPVDVGITMLDFIEELFDFGIDVQMTPTYDLRAYKDRGRDQTDDVTISDWQGFVGDENSSTDAPRNTLLVRTEDDYQVHQNANSLDKWGRREGFISISRTPGTSISRHVSAAFAENANPRNQRQIDWAGDDLWPYWDWSGGDLIRLIGYEDLGAASEVRVVSNGGEEDEEGNIIFPIIVGTRRKLREERLRAWLEVAQKGTLRGRIATASTERTSTGGGTTASTSGGGGGSTKLSNSSREETIFGIQNAIVGGSSRAARQDHGHGTPMFPGHRAVIGDGSATTFDITHNLFSFALIVQVWDDSTSPREQVFPDYVAMVDGDTVRIAFTDTPDTDQYRVAILDVMPPAAEAH